MKALPFLYEQIYKIACASDIVVWVSATGPYAIEKKNHPKNRIHYILFVKFYLFLSISQCLYYYKIRSKMNNFPSSKINWFCYSWFESSMITMIFIHYIWIRNVYWNKILIQNITLCSYCIVAIRIKIINRMTDKWGDS